MEERGMREMSFLVFGCFILLFLFFLFISPNGTTKGAFTFDGVVGSAEIGGVSLITLLIILVILIIVLVAVFLLIRKFRKRKPNFVVPSPSVSPEGMKRENKDFPPLDENVGRQKKGSKQNLGDEDIENLFSDDFDVKKEQPAKEQFANEPPFKKDNPSLENLGENKGVSVGQAPYQSAMTNLNSLKIQIRDFLGKGYGKDQIFNMMAQKGFTQDQIARVVEELNSDSLREYIQDALRHGFSKDQIIRNLAAHGWKMEQIGKFLK